MTKDGFVVSGFDGRAPRGEEWSFLPKPFLHEGFRADAWGQRTRDQLISFGEAKTCGDINTAHTRRQLSVLGYTSMKRGESRCPLYIAIPRSAVYELDRVLIDIRLLGAKNVVRLHIPDVLLEEASGGSRQDYCPRA
jgi:hypothetical protein